LNVKRYKGIKNKSMKITSALRHFVEDGKDLVELMKLDDDCDDCIFIGISSAKYVQPFNSVLF